MSKKIISVVLALVLVLTTFAVSAFAVGGIGYEEDNTYKQTWALTNKKDNGDGTWSVDVNLTANYVVGAISFQVTNPADKDGKLVNAKLTGVTKGSALTYEANIKSNESTGLVAIIPEPLNDADEGVDLTNGGVIATLTFTLTGDSEKIAIINAPKTAEKPGGDLIAVRLSDNNLTTGDYIYGQEVVSTGATETLGNVAAADPVLSGVDTGFVDAENKYVYGVPAGANPADYFKVENGTFDMVANADGYTNGTGATLVVKNTANEEFATYTLIIFGDVNGDGAITAGDYTVVKDASLGATIEDAAANFAGDINGDGSITAGDYTVVKEASLGGSITANPYAA